MTTPNDNGPKTFTLEGRIVYPNLAKARAKEPGKRETYDAMCIWGYNTNPQVMQEINAYLQQQAAAIHQGVNPAALMLPIKKFDTYIKQDGSPNAEFLRNHYWVNASSQFAPVVAKDSPMGMLTLNPADIEIEAWSGRQAVFNISFWPIIPKPGDRNQRRGFGVNIHAVLLREGGERIQSAANIDPAKVFGQFAAMAGMNQGNGQFNQNQNQQMNAGFQGGSQGQNGQGFQNMNSANSQPNGQGSSNGQAAWNPNQPVNNGQQNQQQQQQPNTQWGNGSNGNGNSFI